MLGTAEDMFQNLSNSAPKRYKVGGEKQARRWGDHGGK